MAIRSLDIGQDPIIGRSSLMENLLNTIRLVAVTDATVLISGESGTGKELIARFIHNHSRRAGHALVSINCAAIPESIAESELFGHRRGSYTNAHTDYIGKIPKADGSSLFLDEISELPYSIQGKLLRFLESSECQAVGDTEVVQSNVRIICASNRSLASLCQQKLFREDLYFRLNVVPIHIPPLRERKGDIEMLLTHYTDLFARQYQLSPIQFDPDCLSVLKKYHWPGNIRELKNFCERMSILFPGLAIRASNLPHDMRNSEWVSDKPVFKLPRQGIKLIELERQLLSQALENAQGNYSQAARLLGLSRHSFNYRYKKHGLR